MVLFHTMEYFFQQKEIKNWYMYMKPLSKQIYWNRKEISVCQGLEGRGMGTDYLWVPSLFWGKWNSLKLVVVMVTQSCEYMKKTTELCTLKGWILRYVNCMSKKKRVDQEQNKQKHSETVSKQINIGVFHKLNSQNREPVQGF